MQHGGNVIYGLTNDVTEFLGGLLLAKDRTQKYMQYFNPMQGYVYVLGGVVGKWSFLARSHAHETKYCTEEYNEFEEIDILISYKRLDSNQVHA